MSKSKVSAVGRLLTSIRSLHGSSFSASSSGPVQSPIDVSRVLDAHLRTRFTSTFTGRSRPSFFGGSHVDYKNAVVGASPLSDKEATTSFAGLSWREIEKFLPISWRSSRFSSAGAQVALQKENLPPLRPEASLPPTTPHQKPRIVVLGAGWAACRLLKEIDTNLYDIVCISPRNHMVFTPLLASTCVGTLEFRSVTEPVRGIQPALSKSPDSYFFLAKATGVDPTNRQVLCEALEDDDALPTEKRKAERHTFKVAYDKLVIASGAEASTFHIPGVEENATFLREVEDAVTIRRKLLYNLMKSEIPGIPEQEKERLLSIVVVGGGPTGVEFSGELSDFILRDVCSKFTHVRGYINVTLIEANEILSSFDIRLRQYASNHLHKSGVRLVKGLVKEVFSDRVLLTNGSEVPYGILVWSTGVGPSSFVKSLGLEKSPGGRIGVDEYLHVKGLKDVYAIGDCAGYHESTNKPVLPALAQVAEREGKYLAKCLNQIGGAGGGRAGQEPGGELKLSPFVYRHLGSMATVGRYKALVDLRQGVTSQGLSLAGFTSWLVWRSAYLTRVISWRNRLYVAVNWATTFFFGRDISRL